jgi:Na+/H+ antiporter NhaD/arsenite permease-like protein
MHPEAIVNGIMDCSNGVIGLAIFILTYILISLQNVPKLKLDRPAASTIGASLMIAFGVMSIDEAVRSIDYHTIILLFGMMVLSSYLGIAGFFDYLAYKIMKTARNGKRLLLMIVLSSGCLSAIFVNDTICVFMTPVVVKLALSSNINPVPLLIALATSANIGSVATIIGNPQNMLIGMKSGIRFVEFTANMLPVSLVGLIMCYALIYGIYKNELSKFRITEIPLNLNRELAIKSVVVFLFVLLLFVTEVYPISVSALIGAAIIFIIGGIRPKVALERVDWGLLLLFCNLFIVTHGFEKAYGNYLTSFLSYEDNLLSFYKFSFLTVLGSNLVSNVPFVMMVLPAMKAANEKLWYILAMASTFAGNLTLIGSVANLIVAENAEKYGVRIDFFEYLKVGIPLTILTVLIGTAIIYFI